MAGRNDAFVHIATKCPLCQRDSRHRYVKSKLYKPLEMESDQHVRTYRWETPQHEAIRPNFYHIWHCPFCHFCDEKEVFRDEDDSGGKLELIREKLLISSRAPNSIFMRLGDVIDLRQEVVTLDSALAAHLLAIHVQEMLSTNNRQYPKLGRFYLRTAWLYREGRELKDVPRDPPPEGFDDWSAFLESLQDEWPEIPLTEDAAMDQAIRAFNFDLERSGATHEIRHEVGVMFLLADLSERRDKLDDALRYVRHIFQAATRKRQVTRGALDRGAARKEASAQKIESMRSLITWLNNAIERATTLSERLNQIIFEREYPRAREIVLAMEEPSVQAILQRLREEGFHEYTARRIAALYSKRLLALGETDPTAAPPEPEKPEGLLQTLIQKFTGDKGK
jgi:hypothetical protein